MDIFRVCTLVIKTKDQFAPFSFYGYCVIMALWLVVKRTFLLYYSAFGVGCNNVALKLLNKGRFLQAIFKDQNALCSRHFQNVKLRLDFKLHILKVSGA